MNAAVQSRLTSMTPDQLRAEVERLQADLQAAHERWIDAERDAARHRLESCHYRDLYNNLLEAKEVLSHV